MRKLNKLLVSIIAIAMIISTTSAIPEILDGFNIKYNTIGTKLDTCKTCHIPTKLQRSSCNELCHIPKKAQKDDNSLNSYGMSIKKNLNIGISQVLSIVESQDSDGDKFSNIDEIRNLTFPGDKSDSPKKQKSGNILGLFNFSIQ